MRILIIGANGRTGRHVISKVVANGHEAIAFTRSESSSVDANQHFSGDAQLPEDLRPALSGVDVVISVVGHVKGTNSDMQTRVMQSLVNEVKDNPIPVVSLTGTGVRLNKDRITLIDRVLNFVVSIIDNNRVKDGKMHFETLQESNLDYRLLRVLKLTDSKPNGYKLCEHGPAKTFVSRQDVAAALVELAESNAYSRKAPILCR